MPDLPGSSSMLLNSPAFVNLLTRLAEQAADLEEQQMWPGEQLAWLVPAGVAQWVIPEPFGGSGISALDLTLGYELLAEACLTTAFILTQRNGACQRIADLGSPELREELLPQLGRGEIFATVGISHLTTSRQHLAAPAVSAVPEEGEYVLNGTVPWVTGGIAADYIVTGGALEDGRQILMAVPRNLPGVTIGEAQKLLALNASQTGPIYLKNVQVPEKYLLAGPEPRVMSRGGGGAGSLSTSALAIGAARRGVKLLEQEAAHRSDLAEIHNALKSETDTAHADLVSAASGVNPNPDLTPETIRARANSLVLRASQAALAASKGAGFVAGHPAEQLAREALFFLVWSCPQPVLQANLRSLAQGINTCS